MNAPRISVIVPVYNASKYIEKCLDSILCQTFTDYELIIINDGSTDASLSIINRYLENDARIKVFNTENQGICKTREFGISLAKGEYIKFVDSDDYVESSMLAKMYEMAKKNKSDVVICGFSTITNEGITPVLPKVTTHDEIVSSIIKGDYSVVWKSLVNRNLLIENDIHFPLGVNFGEDYVFMSNIALCSKLINCVQESLYYYNQCNTSSVMSSLTLDKVFSQIRATKEVETLLEMRNIKNKFRREMIERKLWSKAPLAAENWEMWLQIFPEVNEMVIKTQKGKRAWLRRFFRNIADRF